MTPKTYTDSDGGIWTVITERSDYLIRTRGGHKVGFDLADDYCDNVADFVANYLTEEWEIGEDYTLAVDDEDADDDQRAWYIVTTLRKTA